MAKQPAVGFFAVGLIVALLTVACGGGDGATDEGAQARQQETAVGAAADKDPVKVAMLFTGPRNGGAWDRAGFKGLQAIEADLGAEIAFAESVDLGAQVEAFSDFAEHGFDIVIGHSDAFRDGAIEAAGEFPDIWFVSTGTGTTGGQQPPSNFVAVELRENEIGYLSGYAAGLATETGKVGWIGSLPLIGIGQAMEGHKVGVADANPNAAVSTAFVGSFVDAARAKEAAFTMIGQGADVLTHNADLAGLGVIEAAAQEGALVIGHSLDQSAQASDAVMTSVVLDFGRAYGPIVEELQQGSLEGGPRVAGVAEGVISLAPIRNVSDEVAARIKERVAVIADGSFTVPDVTFTPEQ